MATREPPDRVSSTDQALRKEPEAVRSRDGNRPCRHPCRKPVPSGKSGQDGVRSIVMARRLAGLGPALIVGGLAPKLNRASGRRVRELGATRLPQRQSQRKQHYQVAYPAPDRRLSQPSALLRPVEECVGLFAVTHDREVGLPGTLPSVIDAYWRGSPPGKDRGCDSGTKATGAVHPDLRRRRYFGSVIEKLGESQVTGTTQMTDLPLMTVPTSNTWISDVLPSDQAWARSAKLATG